MATPPTFVAEYEVAPSTVGAGARTVSVTVSTGDVLVIYGVTEADHITLGTPSGGGLTYTLQQSIVVTDYCGVYVWTAVSASSQTYTLSITMAGGTAYWGYSALRFSGSDGVGASSKTNVLSGAPSLAVTSGADNSAVVAAVGDWNASDGASRTWRTVNSITPTAGNNLERTYARDSSRATFYAAYWNDAGTAGSKTTGLSAPSGQKYSIVAVEVEGTAGGGSTVTGTATAPFTFSTTGAGQRTALGAAALAVTAATAAAGQRTVHGTAACAITAGTPAAGSRTVAGSATRATTAAATATGIRTTAGSAASSTTFAGTAAGLVTRSGAATAAIAFGTSVAGQRTVAGTAARATTFTSTAVGAGSAETVTGTATAPFTFSAPTAGTRTVSGTAGVTATFTAAATGHRTAAGSGSRVTQFAAPAAGLRSVRGTATAPFVFTAAAAGPADSIVTRPDTGTVSRPSGGTVTRPYTGVVTRP